MGLFITKIQLENVTCPKEYHTGPKPIWLSDTEYICPFSNKKKIVVERRTFSFEEFKKFMENKNNVN